MHPTGYPHPQVRLALPATYMRSQSYQCRAWATNDAGEGDASQAYAFWTPPAAPVLDTVLADDGQIFAYVTPADNGNRRAPAARAGAGERGALHGCL